MINRSFFSAFAILLAILFAAESNAQCGDIQIKKSVDCQTGATTVEVIAHGPNGPYHIQWPIDGDTSWTKVFSTPGTYQLHVWGDSCFQLITCVTTQPVCCLSAYWDSTPDDCKAAPTGSATIFFVENGVGPFTYEWHAVNDDLSINPNVIGTGTSIHNVHGGNYVVYIHDLGNNNPDCFLEQWVYVEQQTGPTVKLNASDLTCTITNTTVSTQVTGGPVSYAWNTGVTTDKLTNVGPGTYAVTVTNANGCSDSDSITITAPVQVTLHATATPTACGENNGALTLTSGPWPITVESPNGSIFNLNGPTATISNLQSGVYTATVTNGSGCTMVESAVVGDSDPAKDSLECITICQPGFVNGTWVATSTTLTDTLTNASGCKFAFKTIVNMQTSDTTHQTAFACFGGVITVNGVTYEKDTVVYVQMNGNCPGLTVWDLQFSDSPDSISLPLVKICGGDSLQTYTFTNVMGADCPELKVYRSFVHQPYTLEFELTTTETICGLGARTDSLFKPIIVDNVNCKITQPYGLLVTNTPTTTITHSPTHFICGTPADSTWVETSDVMDIVNCKRNITGYWQVITPQPLLHRDTIYTCFDSIATLYPHFAPGTDCNPDTLTTAVLEEKPAMAILFKDTCNYDGPQPIAPIMINHPGNNCLGDTMIIVNPHYSVTTYGNEKLCSGDTLHLGNLSITTEGDYQILAGQTQFGCDSLRSVHVTMVFGTKFETTQDTCDLSVAGQKFWTVSTSPNGCVDSTEVTLTWLSGFKLDTTVVICAQRPDGLWHVSDTLQINGCWGTSDTTFILSPGYKTTFAKTCDPALDGKLKTKAWVPASVSGEPCDEWIYTYWKLRIIPETKLPADTICEGMGVMFEGSMVYPQTSTVLSHVYDIDGCDSLVTQFVFVNPIVSITDSVFVCEGEDYAYGDQFLEPGTHTFILPANNGGCDTTLQIVVSTYTDELFGFVPDSLVLSAPEGMNLSSVDQWVTGLASGDWLGSIHNGVWTMVREDLFFIGSTDSTVEYIQAWVLQGPCGKMEFSRTIIVNLYQKDEPTGPICDIKIITPLSGEMSITVNSIPGKTITNVQAWIFNLGTGKLEMMPIVGLGFNPISGVTLPHGATFALRMTAQIDGKTRTLWNEEGPILHKFERM